MKTKIYYVGYDWQEQKIRRYANEQQAKECSTNYQVIEAGDYKEAVEIFKESHYVETENRDL